MDIDNRTKKRKTGDLGEGIACKFLERKGFKILERNYLKKYGEIDIVASNKGIIHFIEVKSVSCEINTDILHETPLEHRPEDNLHVQKLRRLENTIRAYLLEKNVSHETDWVCNALIVYIDNKKLISKVKIIENILI